MATNAAIKAILVLALLVLYSLAALFLALLPAGRSGRRRLLVGNMSFFARLALQVIGVRVMRRVRGGRRPSLRNHLIVSNHLSYVDILVIASAFPAVFITSIELRKTFPLGLLALLGGSLFVERRDPSGLRREIRDIARTLQNGASVVLFPEGTTSNGDAVRPFKNALFTAAIETGTPVLPLCLRYRRINGRRIGDRTRDALYYYGGVTFPVHAPRLLALRSVHVECLALAPIAVNGERSRKDLAARCHAVISGAYGERSTGARNDREA